MKSFNQLTSEQKTQAVRKGIDLLINLIYEGVIEVKMPSKTSQDLLNEIITKHRRAETPTMVKAEIMKSTILKPKIQDIAIKAAKGAKYNDNGLLTMTHI